MLKISLPTSQIFNSLPPIEPAQFLADKSKSLNPSLLIETAVVTTAAILAIKTVAASSVSRTAWLVAPGILVAAALIPTVVRRDKFATIGFNIQQISHSLVLFGWTCIVVFPTIFCSLWLLKYWDLGLPLCPVLPQGQGWVSWLFYQFMYVAIAEEVFFRGYVQGNIARLTDTVKAEHRWLQQWISIVISAACFAVAHIIVAGQIMSGLTFLPGLILGWLFVRTRSLLAPILFHGLANTCYCLTAIVLA